MDGNVEYDSLDILSRDMEEKYFDDEDSESIHSGLSSGYRDNQKPKDGVPDYEQYEAEEIDMKDENS